MEDEKYMLRALALASQGVGWVNPNPMVGAVIVKDGEIIGEGYHQRFGEPHAERQALKNINGSAEGATIYVTLEPCSHYGKTPPCTEAIISSGISRVVVGTRDPNPLVAGSGIKILQEQGIEVVEGILAERCQKINEVFFHYIQQRTPFVVMKYAMTMDGKIATRTGQSKWITGEEARQKVHEDRHRFMGIMVGVGTILADDPLLTCRLPNHKNPLRIICDTHLKTPLTAQVVTTAKNVRTLFATCSNDQKKIQALADAGCEIIVTPTKNEQVDLNFLMEKLGAQGIDSLLLEGGATLNWSALSSGIVKKIQTYLAPKIFGGLTAKSPITGCGVDLPDAAFQLMHTEITQLGTDFLLESEVKRCLPE